MVILFWILFATLLTQHNKPLTAAKILLYARVSYGFRTIREHRRQEEERGKEVCCVPACELTMASAASSGEIVTSKEKVCVDLYKAASNGKLDKVSRLLPVAEEKGVINKVTA